MDNKGNDDIKAKIAMLRGVRQIRQFTAQPVPQQAIKDILEVARWTGSAMNEQPWEFVLVPNHDTLKEIAAAEGANSHIAGADFAILVIMAGKNPGMESYDEGRLSERLLLAAAAHAVRRRHLVVQGWGRGCQAHTGHTGRAPGANCDIVRLPRQRGNCRPPQESGCPQASKRACA